MTKKEKDMWKTGCTYDINPKKQLQMQNLSYKCNTIMRRNKANCRIIHGITQQGTGES